MNKIQTSTLPHALEQQDSQFACAFALIGAAIRERVTPGAVIAVTYREQLVAWKAFGRFTYEEDGTSVQPPTVFDLASVTKVVATTSMAMLLHERGKLDLKTKVRDFFRQFHDAEKQEVSIGMLLSHCSGLAPYEKLFLRCKRRNELIAATAASPLVYSPGTRSEYSDMGFIFLGEILVRVARSEERRVGKECRSR